MHIYLINLVEDEEESKMFHSHTDSPYSRGVSALINKNLECDIVSSKSDNDGRIVLVNLVINNNEYTC